MPARERYAARARRAPVGPADRRRRRCGGLRRMGDSDAQRHHRWHGQCRFALVPHAALVTVRRNGLDGRDLLLRSDLLRLVLPGELRGSARDPDPHLCAGFPVAASEPRLPRARPGRRLGDGEALRPWAAGAPRRRNRAGRRDHDRLPGGRGAERRRRRHAPLMRGGASHQRPRRARQRALDKRRRARFRGCLGRTCGRHQALVPGARSAPDAGRDHHRP